MLEQAVSIGLKQIDLIEGALQLCGQNVLNDLIQQRVAAIERLRAEAEHLKSLKITGEPGPAHAPEHTGTPDIAQVAKEAIEKFAKSPKHTKQPQERREPPLSGRERGGKPKKT